MLCISNHGKDHGTPLPPTWHDRERRPHHEVPQKRIHHVPGARNHRLFVCFDSIYCQGSTRGLFTLENQKQLLICWCFKLILSFMRQPTALVSNVSTAWPVQRGCFQHTPKSWRLLHVAIATEGRGLSKCLELYCFEAQPIARIQILYKWIRLD